MTEEEIEGAIDALKLQRFWPHEAEIEKDATAALEVIGELHGRIAVLTKRCEVLERMVDQMTSKYDWEVLVDLESRNRNLRRAMDEVEKMLAKAGL